MVHTAVYCLDLSGKTWRLGHPDEERTDHRFYRLGHSHSVLANRLMFIFGGEIIDPILKTSFLSNDIL